MNCSKYRILSFAVSVLNVCAALAQPVSNRFAVTVRGKGPDVLLVPGLACSSAVWDGTAKRLEGHYRLHILQVAGFGGLPAGPNASGDVLQPTVDAIDLYVRTNHLKSPKLIGHSMGGLMGMMLAIQHPDDLGKMMVVDSLPFFGMLAGAKDAASAKAQAAPMRDFVLSESQDDYVQGQKQFLGTLVKSPEGLKQATSWAVASDKSVVARAMYEDMTTDLRADLPKIKSPVTMLYPWDTKGGYTREATDKFYQSNFAALPGCKLVCVENSLHFIMLDQPEKFAEAVDGFLK